jgi:hypothetical protein
MSYPQPLSTELALRAFEADARFSTALSAFQAQSHGVSGLAALLANANANGFSWIIKPKKEADDFQWQVSLRHAEGAEESAYGNEPESLLLYLLGFPLVSTAQASDAEKLQNTHGPQDLKQEPAPEPLEVVMAPAAEPAPDAPVAGPKTLLTEEQRATALEMVKVMNGEQRKAFTISFRSAFNVPRDAKTIAPLIQELQHLHFVDRFTVEAAGGVAP